MIRSQLYFVLLIVIWILLASGIDGCFIIMASYAGCNAMLVGLFFTISVGAEGFLTSSMLVNPMDLSPNYSGTITGMGNGIGSLMGIAVPSIIGLLTPNVCCAWSIFTTFFLCISHLFLLSKWISSHWHPNGASFFGSHLAFIARKLWYLLYGDREKCSPGMRHQNPIK